MSYDKEVMKVKVFKMNDCDLVAAENEEQAKEYYQKLTGYPMEEIDADFEGEVSLTETMYVPFDSLPPEEKRAITSEDIKERYGELCVERSLEWALKNLDLEFPCVIASTEC